MQSLNRIVTSFEQSDAAAGGEIKIFSGGESQVARGARGSGGDTCLRRVAGLLVIIGCLLCGSGAWAVGGELLWEEQADLGGELRALAVADRRVFAGGSNFIVQAYTGKRGTLLWEDRDPLFSGDEGVFGITTADGRVYAAGVTSIDHITWLVRAYEAATGTLLWQDQFTTNGVAEAFAITVAEGRVFVSGDGTDSTGTSTWLVRAYEATTGTLLWQDHSSLFGPAVTITAAEGRVFAAGRVGTGNNVDFLVRAYDAATGTLLWEDQLDLAELHDEARGIAVDQGRVFVAGIATGADKNTDFLVRTYEAATGALLWQDQFDPAGRDDEANTLTVAGERVFVVGRAGKEVGNSDWLVRTYDTTTGALLWQEQFDLARDGEKASAVVIDRGSVFVAGEGTNAAGDQDFLVRAYEAASGTLLWADQRDLAGGDDVARAIGVAKGRVFVAGEGMTATDFTDVLIRAYDAQ